MSKVTITLELDRYICTELSDVREMVETLDFSGLKASVERIQKHANSMESALRNYNQYMSEIKDILSDKNENDIFNVKAKKTSKLPLNDKEKLEAIKEILKKKYHEW